MENIDARKLKQDAQEIIRKKAVQLVLTGKKRKEVAAIFNVTTEAIRKWMIKYKKKGFEGLKKSKRGRRNGGKLKNYQAATICNMIRDRNPDQLKLPFYLWTAEAVRDLIKRKYGIKYGIRQVQRYLEKWGYTPQKPKRLAYEQNTEDVKKWMEEVSSDTLCDPC